MSGQAGSDEDTRGRLVAAATRLFSEHGFRRVTVREICREAHANLSAVNYHFGDKLGLYREVVAVALARVRGDPTTDVDENAPPEEKIRHYVRTFVPRLAAPRGEEVWVMKLMRHELHEPTALAPWIAEQAILPRIRFLARTIAELIGCPPDDPRVRRSVISLQAQCLFYMPNNFRKVAFPDWRDPPAGEIEQAAEHIASLTIAGIRAISDPS